MDKKNDSLSYISICRGIGIFLVVLGHTIVPEMRRTSIVSTQIYNIIYTFHMPMYAMLSGYLFERYLAKYREQGFLKFLLKKSRSLMVPYLSFSCISYVGIALAMKIPTLSGILRAEGYTVDRFSGAVLQILTYNGHIDKHIWFVYSLFIVFVISYLLSPVFRHSIGLVASMAMFVCARLYPVPTLIYYVIYLLLYFSLARQTKLFEKAIQKKFLLPSILVFCTMYILKSLGLLGENIVFSGVTNIITAISGSLTILILSHILAETRSAGAINFLSKYSFEIYLIHQPFIVSGVGGILLKVTDLPYPVICTITLILGIGLPVFLTKFVINKIKPLRLILLGELPK